MSAYPPIAPPAYVPTPAPRLPAYSAKQTSPPDYEYNKCYKKYIATPWRELTPKGMWEKFVEDKNEMIKRHDRMYSQPPMYDATEQEKFNLKLHQTKREAWYLQHAKMIIDDLVIDKKGNRQKKGIKYRTALKDYLEWICFHTFQTEEEETETLGKLGEGIWDLTKMRNAFGIRYFSEIMDVAEYLGVDINDE